MSDNQVDQDFINEVVRQVVVYGDYDPDRNESDSGDSNSSTSDPTAERIAAVVAAAGSGSVDALANALDVPTDSAAVRGARTQFSVAEEIITGLATGEISGETLLLTVTAVGSEVPRIGVVVDVFGNLAAAEIDDDSITREEVAEIGLGLIAPVATLAVNTVVLPMVEAAAEARGGSLPTEFASDVFSMGGVDTLLPNRFGGIDVGGAGGGGLGAALIFQTPPEDVLHPVVIDLEGDGFQLSLMGTASFDLDDDGFKEQMGWVGPSDALLVIDLGANGSFDGGDGVIDSQEEFVFTSWDAESTTDLQALASATDDNGNLIFDSNADGILSSQDAHWNSFKLWQDLDQDGVTDKGELLLLSDLGISELNLAYNNDSSYSSTEDDLLIAGSTVHGMASYVRNGQTVTNGIADVSFAFDDNGWRHEQTGTGFNFIWQDGTEQRYLELEKRGGSPDETLSGSTYNGVYGDSRDNQLYAGAATIDVILDGASGNDRLVGGQGNDQLIGGEGADRLYGGDGNDTLVVDFLDIITNDYADDNGLSSYGKVKGGAGRDTLIVTGDRGVHFTLENKQVEIVYGSEQRDILDGRGQSTDVFIEGAGGNDLIYGSSHSDQLSGGTGSDNLYAGSGNDILDAGAGGSGNQYLYGGAGDDTYVVSSREGHSWITRDAETASSGSDTVRFTSLAMSDVRFRSIPDSQNGSGTNGDSLLISWSVNGENGSLESADLGSNIERLEFADGSAISRIDVDAWSGNRDRLVGTSADDVIYGTDETDIVYGGAGDDILGVGGHAGGWQHLRGGLGDDTYLVDRDSGSVEISATAETGGTDTLIFRDLAMSDVYFRTGEAGVVGDASDDNLEVRWSVDGETGRVNLANNGSAIERLEFADGTTLTSIEIDGRSHDRDVYHGGDTNDTIVGSSGSDYIFGEAGDDVLNAGEGSGDWQYLYGGAGDDTFVYGVNGGRVYISAGAETATTGTNDVVRLTDLNLSDLTFSTYDYTAGGTKTSAEGEALRITWNKDGKTGELRIANDAENIESFEFADGTTLSRIDVDAYSGGRERLVGTSSSDVIQARDDADIVHGGAGHDRLYGGAGHDHLRGDRGSDRLYGGGGNDTLSGGTQVGFSSYRQAHNSFDRETGWRVETHERILADVNGDGRADIVGFGSSKVYVALGKTDGTFASATVGTTSLTTNNGGWTAELHERDVADVNGDGYADLVGFGSSSTFVALGDGTGSFGPLRQGQHGFDREGGWRVETHERILADVNGDGRADIVGFGSSEVYVALGKTDGTFASATVGTTSLTTNSGGWTAELHERDVADVNGDGTADLIGFGSRKTFVALADTDQLNGGNGNDLLQGEFGSDRLAGNNGADRLFGGEANDYLDGGNDNDSLYGGSGADTFHFDRHEEKDIVFDFEDDVDQIEFAGFGALFTTASGAMNFASQVGSDVVFDFGGGDELRIENIHLSDVADDIVFA